MQSKEQFRNLIFHSISRAATPALAMATVFTLAVALTQAAQARTYTVLHTFTGGADGGGPYAGLTMDRAGNLYGTTQGGGKGFGTVFKLAPRGSGWIFTPLYSFQGGNDGASPLARVILGPDGSLYGTTIAGGEGSCSTYFGSGCGTVFKLQPSPAACKTALCPWTETVLYRFTGGSDGGNPENGDLLIDQSGIIYGTTHGGGLYGVGVVFSLSPSQGAWTESVFHSFTGYDGANPHSGVISDNAGNLYGTTGLGGPRGYGTVYELIPSGSGWQVTTLYSFFEVSGPPIGGLIFDGLGSLYGTTSGYFQGSPGGSVFELTPSKGIWWMSNSAGLGGFMDGQGPISSLVMDSGGNLYGTFIPSISGSPGEVFEVTSDWTVGYIVGFMHNSGGSFPLGSLIIDTSGNIYGTCQQDGANYNGVVWESTP